MGKTPVTQSAPAECSPILVDEFVEFVRSSTSDLLRRAYFRCGDNYTAQDLVQETYLRLWIAWCNRPGSIVDLRKYASKILSNVCADHYRKRRPEASGEVPEIVSGSDEGQDTLRDNLWLAVRDLPRQQRELILLHYYDGLQLSEVAAKMKLAPKTVHNYHVLAKEGLRKRLYGRKSVTVSSREPGEEEVL